MTIWIHMMYFENIWDELLMTKSICPKGKITYDSHKSKPFFCVTFSTIDPVKGRYLPKHQTVYIFHWKSFFSKKMTAIHFIELPKNAHAGCTHLFSNPASIDKYVHVCLKSKYCSNDWPPFPLCINVSWWQYLCISYDRCLNLSLKNSLIGVWLILTGHN